MIFITLKLIFRGREWEWSRCTDREREGKRGGGEGRREEEGEDRGGDRRGGTRRGRMREKQWCVCWTQKSRASAKAPRQEHL